jgi:uncharacterized protein (DUF1501 family)
MTTKKTRRTFLGQTGSLLLGACAVPSLAPGFRVFAEPLRTRADATKDAKSTLVVIYLRGGADALNVVVPYANRNYYEVRPTISIPPKEEDGRPGVVPLDDTYGLHPALAPLKPYWDAKQCAAIIGVGSPDNTRSHFDAQDFMEYGAPGNRGIRQGWLNRYLEQTRTKDASPMRALAIQGLLPRSLRGSYPVLAVPRLRQSDSEGLLDLFDDVYKNHGGMEKDMHGGELSGGALEGRNGAVDVGRNTIETLRHFWEITESGPPTKAKYPRGSLGSQLATIARVIKANEGLEVAAVDLGGWDTHQGQGSTDGSFQPLLARLGEAMAAFAGDIGDHLKRTTILVMTEFGRTVAENGNRGTDHGRGGMMLCLGGSVAGAQVLGTYGTLEQRDLEDKRDLRVTVDYRAVFQETLKGAFGFETPKEFFPLFSRRDPIGLFPA